MALYTATSQIFTVNPFPARQLLNKKQKNTILYKMMPLGVSFLFVYFYSSPPTYRADRSRWTKPSDSRYFMPEAIWVAI